MFLKLEGKKSVVIEGKEKNILEKCLELRIVYLYFVRESKIC